MRKTDVEFHSDYGRDSHPAVNVKVYKSPTSVPLPLELGTSYPSGHPELAETSYTDPRFDRDYLASVSDEVWESVYRMTLESAWESLQDYAREIWGKHVRVYSEGRSGGWAYVQGLPDFDSWDAIELGRWARFSKYAKSLASGIPEAMVWDLYTNVWEPEHLET